MQSQNYSLFVAWAFAMRSPPWSCCANTSYWNTGVFLPRSAYLEMSDGRRHSILMPPHRPLSTGSQERGTNMLQNAPRRLTEHSMTSAARIYGTQWYWTLVRSAPPHERRAGLPSPMDQGRDLKGHRFPLRIRAGTA